MINIGLLSLLTDPLVLLLVFAATLFALVLHNIAQAFLAWRLGDDTSRNYGFTSTDPRVHIEPMYLLFFVLLGFILPRPIPLLSRRIRQRGAEASIWLAGPLVMILFAFVELVIAVLIRRFFVDAPDGMFRGLEIASDLAIRLAIIFLVPVPPLDGARALAAVGSPNTRRLLAQMEAWGPIGFILIFLVLSQLGVLSVISGFIKSIFLALLAAVGL